MIKENISVRLPTEYGDFQMKLFMDPRDGKEHLVLVHGDITSGHDILLRIHSECLTGDVFRSLRCDCGAQLNSALEQIAEESAGILIYLRQEGRGIGLFEKMKAYALQDEGHDTVEANILLGHQADERDYGMVPEILRQLGIKSVRLITNNPDKVTALLEGDILVQERVLLPVAVNKENVGYLRVKAQKMRHLLNLDEVCFVDR